MFSSWYFSPSSLFQAGALLFIVWISKAHSGNYASEGPSEGSLGRGKEGISPEGKDSSPRWGGGGGVGDTQALK